MDEASDSGCKEQSLVVMRYVDMDFVIQEKLVNIKCTNNTDAKTLSQIMLSSMANVGLRTNKLIG